MTLKKRILTMMLVAMATSTVDAQPVVNADTRFARGATMAFGRITSISANGGSSVTKRGFCIAETPEPTVDDIVSKKTLSNNGVIYYFEDLKPATMYYMRAYATNKDGETGYGETIKFSTLPMGQVTYWYNNGGDEAANTRVNDAATKACEIFNNLTSIRKHYSIGYSAGTPTADCYYADEPWMNMGPSASYQRTGTIMHEMQHGLGLVPYTTQWNKNILRASLDGDGRGTGLWLGDRVSEFLDFWDNTTGSHLNGDYQHMWPYGINGASEDDGTLKTYYANAMIGQALGEDGLEHRSDVFAEPCYVFNQDDNTKYYLKNESESRGLYTSYLVPNGSGLLKWRTMTSAEAQENDSAAWYITFTPENQYYQLRNASTGQYLTFSGGFKTLNRSSLTSADNFHLMKGRVDVGEGSEAKRGYWLIHPTGTFTPNCLQANANGNTGSVTFNIANSATAQRWLILTASEMTEVENLMMAQLKKQTADVLALVKPLAEVPHTENTAGADAAFAAALSDIEQRLENSMSAAELNSLATEANNAAFEFLSNVSATDVERPFDLTYLVSNPGLDTDTEGWSTTATINYSCAEFYQTTFDFNQTIKNLPAGNYRVRAQGFQRPGKAADAYSAYTSGNDKVTAFIYGGTKSKKLLQACAEAQSKKIGGSESAVGGKYIPNDMQSASLYFKKGLYENFVDVPVTTSGASLKVGIRSSTMDSYYWVIFDNFRLHFFGGTDPNDPSGIGAVLVNNEERIVNSEVYDLQGRRVESSIHDSQSSKLKKGFYIVGGKKVVVR